MNKFFLFCSFIFCTQLNGQSLKGKIVDAETGEGLEAVHVFISGSSQGTYTDLDGSFALDDVPEGFFELVITHIGYENHFRNLNSDALNKELEIKLEPTVFILSDIEVTAKSTKKRKRYINTFRRAFLGESPNAKKCEILNPDVLLFHEENGKVIGQANDLVRIRNHALGYEISFLLSKFEAQGEAISYGGKPVFEEMEPETDAQMKLWEKNRQLAYEGSIYHFLQCLANYSLNECGFRIFYAILNSERAFEILRETSEEEIITEGINGEKILTIPQSLKVTYSKEVDETGTNPSRGGNPNTFGQVSGRNMATNRKVEEAAAVHGQISYIIPRRQRLRMDRTGRLTNNSLLIEYGYWSTERVSDLVPFEYFLKKQEEN